jgi:exodeoxyribonuclease V gamma subunit
VDLDISGFKLTGRIDAVYPERLVQYRYAEIKPKDRLKIWIHHLVLNSLETDHYPRSSILMGLAPQSPEPVWKACEYAPLRNSKDVLGRLLETYWEGLMRPVHFFPKASWEYAQRCLKKNSPEKDALRHALHAWEGSDYLRGEREDPYYQACFGKTVPLDDEFRDIAAEVYGPLLKNQKELTNE